MDMSPEPDFRIAPTGQVPAYCPELSVENLPKDEGTSVRKRGQPAKPASSRRPEPATPIAQPGEMPAQPFSTNWIGGLLAALAAPFKAFAKDRDQAMPRAYAGTLALRRWLFFGLVTLTTGLGAFRFWTVLRIDGLTLLEITLLGVFSLLLGWIAFSFWIVAAGVCARWQGVRLDWLHRGGPAQTEPGQAGRTAVLVPVYNEEPRRLFAGLEAICDSLIAAGSEPFDVFLLSDSSKPDCGRAETAGWRRLRDSMRGRLRLFYRRRPRNVGRKSGNIADFCRTWGRGYDYMVVLDADSLMTGRTMTELVRLMDANPGTALIQVPPQVVGRSTLFARIQQFASSVYGPLFATGLAFLQGPDGNYWGHNAIIRIRPFMDHCGLPTLPGKPPLGGEIMSHDFVEAALLRRAGWDVWLLPDLGGSYEEPPPTLVDHLARDRRWCQGNLQHARLVPLRGLTAGSRLHLALGVMSYVSSPLWLLLLVLSVVRAHQVVSLEPATFVGSYPVLALPISHVEEFIRLIVVTAVLLYGPKLLAWLDIVRDRARRAAHGGAFAAAWSILGESVFSTLLAPVTMLSHSWFVLNNLLGRSVGWNSQRRDDGGFPLMVVLRTFLPHTLAAVAAAGLAYWLVPDSLLWLTPLLVGPLMAVPLVQATCSGPLGLWARQRHLFLIPSETGKVAIIDRVRILMAKAGAEKIDAPQQKTRRRIAPAGPFQSVGSVPQNSG